MSEADSSDNGGSGKSIEDVLQRHYGLLLSIEGVVGIAEGVHNTEPSIIVLVNNRSPELEMKIPDSLGGFPVKIKEIDELRAVPGGAM